MQVAALGVLGIKVSRSDWIAVGVKSLHWNLELKPGFVARTRAKHVQACHVTGIP